MGIPPRREESFYLKAKALWLGEVKPGTVMSVAQLSTVLDAKTPRERREVSSFLTVAGEEKRFIEKLGHDKELKVYLYRRLPMTDEILPTGKIQPKEEMFSPEEYSRYCPKCESHFSAIDLGASVLLLLKRQGQFNENQAESIRKLTNEMHELIHEKAELSKHIANQAEKINALSNKLQKKGSTYDLKKLQEKYNSLRKQKGVQ